MEFSATLDAANRIAVAFGLRLLGALALWWAGRWLIEFAVKMIRRALTARDIDVTLQRYLASIVGVVLNIVLAIGILGFLGVETTSFAALMAAAGLAIGAAWGGLLANFAAGVFLVVLRPFRVGDHIAAGGVDGVVQEIGLFATRMTSDENVAILVGNSKLLGDTLKNYSQSPARRIVCSASVPHGMPPMDLIRRIEQRLASIPDVLADPPPDVSIVEVRGSDVTLSVSSCVRPEHYASVRHETQRVIWEETVGHSAEPVVHGASPGAVPVMRPPALEG
jgi:small conductance mechanosensitive channel